MQSKFKQVEILERISKVPGLFGDIFTDSKGTDIYVEPIAQPFRSSYPRIEEIHINWHIVAEIPNLLPESFTDKHVYFTVSDEQVDTEGNRVAATVELFKLRRG